MFKLTSSHVAKALVVGTALGCSAFSAADVKVVSHLHGVAVGRTHDSDITLYYKGDMMRSDVQEYTTIFDAKSGKTVVLNNKKKTYAEVGDDAGMKSIKIQTSVQVTPTDEHKQVAGYNTTKYIANIHMVLTQGKMTQNEDMEMDIWATPDMKSSFVPSHMIRSMGNMMRGLSISGMQEFATEMSKVKGYPLEETLTMNSLPGLPTGMAGSGPVVQYDNVASAVDESALSNSLFAIPSDYKEVHGSASSPGGNS